MLNVCGVVIVGIVVFVFNGLGVEVVGVDVVFCVNIYGGVSVSSVVVMNYCEKSMRNFD